MTLTECLEHYEETARPLFYTYLNGERFMMEVTWDVYCTEYQCYRDYFGAREAIDDTGIDGDVWCPF